MKKSNNYIKIIISIISLILFTIILISINSEGIISFDKNIYELLPKSGILTKIMKIITIFGESITFIIISIILLLTSKNKKENIKIPLNLLCITLIVQSIKRIVKRPRPTIINLITESGYSFPSGHAATSTAFYGLIIYLILKKDLKKSTKILSITSFIILITLICISRIYLGVHYPSDIIAGISIAISYLLTFTLLIENK